MEFRDVIYETDGRLAYITLNRPEKLNALSNNLRGELMEAMREAMKSGIEVKQDAIMQLLSAMREETRGLSA